MLNRDLQFSSLDFEFNQIGDAGAVAISKVLKNVNGSNVVTLNLEANEIGPIGVIFTIYTMPLYQNGKMAMNGAK